MKGEERRKQLLNILSSSNNPVSGGTLAKELNVSRQIIVQDISLLRANGATYFFHQQRLSAPGGQEIFQSF